MILIFTWPLLLTPYAVVYLGLAAYAVMSMFGKEKNE